MQFERIYGNDRKCLTILQSLANKELEPHEIANEFNKINIMNQLYTMCITRLSTEGYLYFEGDVHNSTFVYSMIRLSNKAWEYLDWESEQEKLLQRKANPNMFYKLPSNSYKLLNEILVSENPVLMLDERFENCTQKEEDELRSILYELKSYGFIDTHWADDKPYDIVIYNSARTYEEQLAEYERQISSNCKVEYNIHAKQANIANDNSTINATLYDGLDVQKLNELIETVKLHIPTTEISTDELETVNDSLETINSTTEPNPPKVGALRTASKALKGLSIIKKSTEFGAAVTALINYVSQFM